MALLHPERALQVKSNVAHRHSPGIQANVLSSRPPASRRDPLGTSRGSKLDSRSRGTARSTGPASLCTVFGVWPLAAVGRATSGGVAFLVAEMITELGGQAALRDCLDQRRQESAITGQLRPVLVDPSHSALDRRGHAQRPTILPPHQGLQTDVQLVDALRRHANPGTETVGAAA